MNLRREPTNNREDSIVNEEAGAYVEFSPNAFMGKMKTFSHINKESALARRVTSCM